jgi:hypothetical protein
MSGASNETLPCLNPQNEIHQAGNGKCGKRGHHNMSGAARSSQSGVNQRKPGPRQRAQEKYKNRQATIAVSRESGNDGRMEIIFFPLVELHAIGKQE